MLPPSTYITTVFGIHGLHGTYYLAIYYLVQTQIPAISELTIRVAFLHTNASLF